MKDKPFFVKTFLINSPEPQKLDCGCEIIKKDPPHVTMKCCESHAEQIKNGLVTHNMAQHISFGPAIPTNTVWEPKNFERTLNP